MGRQRQRAPAASSWNQRTPSPRTRRERTAASNQPPHTAPGGRPRVEPLTHRRPQPQRPPPQSPPPPRTGAERRRFQTLTTPREKRHRHAPRNTQLLATPRPSQGSKRPVSQSSRPPSPVPDRAAAARDARIVMTVLSQLSPSPMRTHMAATSKAPPATKQGAQQEEPPPSPEAGNQGSSKQEEAPTEQLVATETAPSSGGTAVAGSSAAQTAPTPPPPPPPLPPQNQAPQQGNNTAPTLAATEPPLPQPSPPVATQVTQQAADDTPTTNEGEPSTVRRLRGSAALHRALGQTAGSSAPPLPPDQDPAPAAAARGQPSTHLKLSKQLLCELRVPHQAQPAVRTYQATHSFRIRALPRTPSALTRRARTDALTREATPSRQAPIPTSPPHQLCAANWAHRGATTAPSHQISTSPAALLTPAPTRPPPPFTESGTAKEEGEAYEEPRRPTAPAPLREIHRHATALP